MKTQRKKLLGTAACTFVVLSGSIAKPTQASYSQSQVLQYTNTTIPSGNTASNTATETYFASSWVAPANPLPGTTYWISGSGVFTSTLLSSLTLKVYVGATAVTTTPSVSLVAGAANYPFQFAVRVKVMPSGKVYVAGTFTYGTAANSVATVDISSSTVLTLPWTATQAFRASATLGLLSTSVTLNDFTVESASPIANS